MLDNSSSALDYCQPPLSFLHCLICTKGLGAFFAYTVANVTIVLPLSVLVVYVGLQHWRTKSAAAATSPSDLFTYHAVAIETLSLIGDITYCVGSYMGNSEVILAGFFLLCVVLPGQDLFHCLTCMERYMAVLQPITYLSMKRTSGLLITNICVACVWLLSSLWLIIAYSQMPSYPIVPFVVWFCVSLSFSIFCSLSVLWTLTRPGPGDGDRNRVDRLKQKAFVTIAVIMGTLVIRFLGFLTCFLIFGLFTYEDIRFCLVIKLAFWFCLPSSLVLPLLFLQRTRKTGRP